MESGRRKWKIKGEQAEKRITTGNEEERKRKTGKAE